MALSAQTVLVTGASRGLGLEFVKQLTKLPNAPEVVIAACRNPVSATKLRDLAQTCSRIKIVKLDVAKDEDIDTTFQEVKTVVGDRGLNLLINNAAINEKSEIPGIVSQSRERMQRHFDMNVSGPIMIIQKFLPLLQLAALKGKQGELSCSKAGVVMISSIMGSQNLSVTQRHGLSLHYKCSKTALNMASIVLSQELKQQGIFLTAIHPGWVRTDMGTNQAPLSPEQSIESCLKVLGDVGEESTGKLLSYTGEVLPY